MTSLMKDRLLWLERATGGLFSLRFLSFGFVGLLGLGVHLLTLRLTLGFGAPFALAQTIATFVAMTFTFTVNNHLTYRDRRLDGRHMLRGLLKFYAVCAVGAAGNIGVGTLVFHASDSWWLAGVAGSAVGSVWNFLLSRSLVWKHAPAVMAVEESEAGPAAGARTVVARRKA